MQESDKNSSSFDASVESLKTLLVDADQASIKEDYERVQHNILYETATMAQETESNAQPSSVSVNRQGRLTRWLNILTETFALKRFLFKDKAKTHAEAEFTGVNEHSRSFLTTYLGKKFVMQRFLTAPRVAFSTITASLLVISVAVVSLDLAPVSPTTPAAVAVKTTTEPVLSDTDLTFQELWLAEDALLFGDTF